MFTLWSSNFDRESEQDRILRLRGFKNLKSDFRITSNVATVNRTRRTA